MILLFGHRRVELCGEWMIERMEASGSGWKAWARWQSKASRGIDLIIDVMDGADRLLGIGSLNGLNT
jgi:hypothetical protein